MYDDIKKDIQARNVTKIPFFDRKLSVTKDENGIIT